MNKELFIYKFINPMHRYVKLKEKCEKYRFKNKVIFYFFRLLYEYYTIKYGVQIPCHTKVGKNFSIGHWGGIVMNPNVILGESVHVMNGVLIGSEVRGKRKGTPIIGNRVWVGTNACIVGKINIGNDVLIAPNAYVNFDVPSHSIVIGNPAKIIYKENATETYIYQDKSKEVNS